MIFERGTQSNTFAIVPTRRFTFILDPRCLPRLSGPGPNIAHFVRDLRLIDPPLTIDFVMPRYLADEEGLRYAERTPTRAVLSVVDRPDNLPRITFSKRMSRRYRDRLTGVTEDSLHASELLALSEFIQADGIITDESRMIDARYQLLQYHRLRIIPFSESEDWMEVCAHGHDIFWSAADYNRHLTIDVFYQWTHWKNRRLSNWFSVSGSRFTSLDVHEDMRNVIMNRFPFLLYSRDMVRFYELQVDHFTRRGLFRRFSTPLGYYMSNFYVHLWGTLDHLTVIAMKVVHLDLEQEECGIEKVRFWRALAVKKSGLRGFMRSPRMTQWVSTMADMRHAAAHREMLLPTLLVEESEAYKKTDAEISEILGGEEPGFYEGMSDNARAILEPHRIWLWRMGQLETIVSNVVIVRKAKGGYIRFPVDSVDFDLGMVTAVMDAFFVALFTKPAS